ncbi:MAG: UDP-3-O-acylglucosamine N-acyltransferase [candidate division BRC1 bacterium ADurb.BinA364]|nr:MAG: UDP-3-O-acylglucosamine N-acyltransferase [candidate division BRC1 bacterium ADurb.BinA364]
MSGEDREIAVHGIREAAPSPWTLGKLARALDGSIRSGDPEMPIAGVASLQSAGPQDIAFAATEKALAAAERSGAGAFLVPESLEISGRPAVQVASIWPAVCRLIELFRPAPALAREIHPSAHIGHSVRLGQGVAIGPNAVVDSGASIGRDSVVGAGVYIGQGAAIGECCTIHPGAKILYGVTIGNRVIIHSGAVLGADGFRYEVVDGRPMKIPQAGTVVVEDDVEIGANTTIDRAFLDETRIGAGTKIDNLVQIAHNVRLGKCCIFAAQTGLAGSSEIGDGVVLAGQVGVRDNIRIGSGVQIGAQSGVSKDVPDGEIWFGSPAVPMGEWARQYAAQKKSADTRQRLLALERQVGGK